MLSFSEIMLSDKERMDRNNRSSDFSGTEYCFTSDFIWQKLYNIQLAFFEDFNVIKAGDNKHLRFLFPAGTGDRTAVIAAMTEYAHAAGQALRFYSVNQTAKAELEALYPGRFAFVPDRDYSDYIYSTQSLIELKGKKLHAKRNHINKFKQNFEGRWTFEMMKPENVPECFAMNEEWCKQNDCALNPGKQEEMCAVRVALSYFSELNLKGGILRVDGKIVGYTLGEPLNSDTYIIHVEKAFADIQGAYPMINQQFAEHACADYAFINREDDSGSEGLRKAKLSYQPLRLEEKFSAREKQD